MTDCATSDSFFGFNDNDNSYPLYQLSQKFVRIKWNNTGYHLGKNKALYHYEVKALLMKLTLKFLLKSKAAMMVKYLSIKVLL